MRWCLPSLGPPVWVQTPFPQHGDGRRVPSLSTEMGKRCQFLGAAVRLWGREVSEGLRAQGSVRGLSAPCPQDSGPSSTILRLTHLQVVLHCCIQHHQVAEESAKVWDDTLCHEG